MFRLNCYNQFTNYANLKLIGKWKKTFNIKLLNKDYKFFDSFVERFPGYNQQPYTISFDLDSLVNAVPEYLLALIERFHLFEVPLLV